MRSTQARRLAAVATLIGALAAPPGPAIAVSAAAGPVTVSAPRSNMIDSVIHDVATHWAWNEWVDAYTYVTIDDPDQLVARVDAEYIEPDGDVRTAVRLRDRGRDGGPDRHLWSYDPDGYWSFGEDGHVEYGTWTINVTALDVDGNVLATSTRSVAARDPMAAAHPRFLSLRTKKIQTRTRAACPPDTDRHPYCSIRAVWTVLDPDKIFGYAFISDKGPRWHATSNWVGAKVRRDGDVLTFTDTIPVSGVAGRHQLFIKLNSVQMVEWSWPSSYVQGRRDVSFTWRLRLRG